MQYEIVPLKYGHVSQVVDVHIKAFPGFFLSFLGPSFLKQFYMSFTEDPAGIGFVAINTKTQKVEGSVVGPLVPNGYFKRLLKRKWWSFCLASLTAVLKKPTVIKRLFRAAFYRGDVPAGREGLALLSSIAVLPDVQAKGIGAALVNAFLEEVMKKGGKGIYLTTDADLNDKVNRFYQQRGFTLDYSYTTREGRKMNRYVYLF